MTIRSLEEGCYKIAGMYQVHNTVPNPAWPQQVAPKSSLSPERIEGSEVQKIGWPWLSQS